LEVCVELYFDADFVDVFQVRGIPRKVHGQYNRPILREKFMMFYYRGLDGLLRQTRLKMIAKPLILEERKARWDLELLSKNQVQIQVTVIPTVSQHVGIDESAGNKHCVVVGRVRFRNSLGYVHLIGGFM